MSFGWVAIANYSNRALGFLTLLILAKLLPPETFGAIAIAHMLIHILYIMKDMGVSQALIYKKDRVEEAASTGFILVTGINTGLFLVAVAISIVGSSDGAGTRFRTSVSSARTVGTGS